MIDFFISYTSADTQWAEWIGYILEEEGFTVVIQAWDFRPGSNFVLEMHSAASCATRTIMVLSPDYLQSQFASPEWAAAFARDPHGLWRSDLKSLVRSFGGVARRAVYEVRSSAHWWPRLLRPAKLPGLVSASSQRN